MEHNAQIGQPSGNSKKVSSDGFAVPQDQLADNAHPPSNQKRVQPKRNIAKMVNQANQNLKNNFNDIDSV